MEKIKRKAISKTVRKAVYEKYDGHCAYCGCVIAMAEMQIDHMEAVYLHQIDSGGEMTELNDISNLMPACRACNFYKSTFGIEKFRHNLETLPARLEKFFIYRLAKKYGLIKEINEPVKFYFEKHKETEND